jgi:hypothetical protein
VGGLRASLKSQDRPAKNSGATNANVPRQERAKGKNSEGITGRLKEAKMAALAEILHRIAIVLVLTLVAGNGAATGQTTRDAPVTAEALPAGFASAIASVNGTTLHYVAGGQGPPMILIHGFPENWSAYGKIMPRLASPRNTGLSPLISAALADRSLRSVAMMLRPWRRTCTNSPRNLGSLDPI